VRQEEFDRGRECVSATPARTLKPERIVARTTLDRGSASPVGYAVADSDPLGYVRAHEQRERCQHGNRHSVERSDLLSLPVRRRLHAALAVRETGTAGAPKPRLLDRVRDAIGARHYSHRTEKAYIHWIRRYIFFHGKRHPVEMGAPDVTTFLTRDEVRAVL
jgi:Phage integrase, N-terminal SAM-like domain